MGPDPLIREAWLRAEALCECQTQKHGHSDRCGQFLVWADRGGTGPGAWEIRELNDPRRSASELLCAACYAKATGEFRMRRRDGEGRTVGGLTLPEASLRAGRNDSEQGQGNEEAGSRGRPAPRAHRRRLSHPPGPQGSPHERREGDQRERR
jgi:hypothetical protein